MEPTVCLLDGRIEIELSYFFSYLHLEGFRRKTCWCSDLDRWVGKSGQTREGEVSQVLVLEKYGRRDVQLGMELRSTEVRARSRIWNGKRFGARETQGKPPGDAGMMKNGKRLEVSVEGCEAIARR